MHHFLKPFSDVGSREDALESFYKNQASVYDVTRSRLLKGREDMLCLAAAQLKYRELKDGTKKKRIWVDVSLEAIPCLVIYVLKSHRLGEAQAITSKP